MRTPERRGAPGARPVDAADLAAAELAAQVAERTADLQRITAEYANYRRRVDRDREAVLVTAPTQFVGELLTVLDDIERADAHGDLTGPFKAVADKITSVVQKLGLESFGLVGEPFDPSVHEAVQHDTRRRDGPDRAGAVRRAPAGLPRGRPGAAARDGRRSSTAPDDGTAGEPSATVTRKGGGMTQRDWIEKDFYRELGVASGATQRRDQEGVPEARPRAAPGRQPRRRQGRGPLQVGVGGLRRALGREEAQGVRRDARAVRGRRRWLRRRRLPRRLRHRRIRRTAVRPERPAPQRRGRRRRRAARAGSATCSAACSAAAAAARPAPRRTRSRRGARTSRPS